MTHSIDCVGAKSHLWSCRPTLLECSVNLLTDVVNTPAPLAKNQTHVSSACKPTKNSAVLAAIARLFGPDSSSECSFMSHLRWTSSELLSFAIRPVQHEHQTNAYCEVLSVHALYRGSESAFSLTQSSLSAVKASTDVASGFHGFSCDCHLEMHWLANWASRNMLKPQSRPLEEAFDLRL